MMIATLPQRRFTASKPQAHQATQTTDRQTSPELASVPVLVIEDEAMIAWMLESLLEDMGFEAITLASNAREAAVAAERCTPELVISDINLGSGQDGIDAVGAICHTCRPAIVFVSAYVDDAARSRIDHQCVGARILSKPVSGERLAAAITGALRSDQIN